MWWLFLVPLAILLTYSVFSAFKYTRMISNIFMGLVYRPSLEPMAASLGERISILDSSAHMIEALVYGRENASRTVIFCHESGSNKESWAKYTSFLPEQGYRVLSIQFDETTRDPQVNSLSQWPNEQDVERLLMAARWVKRAYPANTHLVLFGVSKGANVALAAAQKIAAPLAVVTDGLFSMKEIFRDYIRKWAPVLVKPNLFGEHYPDWVVNIFSSLGFWHCQKRSGRKFINVEKLLQKGKAPLLMIHGETDDYVPPTHQKFLQRLYGAPSMTNAWVAPEAGHNEAVTIARADYERRVLDFLKRTFGS